MSRITNNNNQESFTFYKSFDDYMDYVEKTFAKVPNSFSSKQVNDSFTTADEDFTGSSNIQELNGKISTFLDPDGLTNAIDNIKNLFSLINLGGAFDKDRLIATDLPLGVFDFSLASQGLYRPQEYYCETLKELVPPESVRKLSSNPSRFVYEKEINGEKHSYNVIEQQKGTLAIILKKAYIEELISKGVLREEAEKLASTKYPYAKLKFQTNTKKVNLVRRSKILKENKSGNEKYVDLFISIGGLASQTPRSLMFKTMPCLLVAYFMDKAGIKTRILGLDSGSQVQMSESDQRGGKRFFNTFVIKEYSDSFDFNDIAILTADSRIFRWKLFKAIVVQFYDKFNYDIGTGLGSDIINQSFIETFERYKTFYIEKQKTESGIKNQNSRLMFASEVTPNPRWDDARMMQMVEEEFFRIVDAIDIEFNGAKTALPRIRDREVKRGIDISNLRQRLVGTVNLATSYDESDSPYTATDKTIQERLAKRTKLTEDVNTIMKII